MSTNINKTQYHHMYGVTLDGVLDWILDLLTTYTHDSGTTSNYSATAKLCT
jgi:hypothetical protein